MNTIRYAIVGTGMMGHEHLRNLALLRDLTGIDVRLIALIDTDEAMLASARSVATSLGFRLPACFDSLEHLPFDEIDAVLLVTPNHTHHALLQRLLPHGKAILTEKPLCTTVKDCEELLTWLDNYPAPFWVAMEYRYMPPAARFLSLLGEGIIGRLHMLSIREFRYPFLDKIDNWNRYSENTGGTLVEKCCHHFDLMRLITGAEPLRIFASGAQSVNHLDENYAGRVPDIIDNAMVVVDFDNGSRASLELCMFAEGADPQETITAIGDRGMLECTIPGPERFWPDAGERKARVVFSSRDQSRPVDEVISIDPALEHAGDHHGSTWYQHRRFAAAILGEGVVEVTADDGAMAVRMGVAAQLSIERGQAVTL